MKFLRIAKKAHYLVKNYRPGAGCSEVGVLDNPGHGTPTPNNGTSFWLTSRHRSSRDVIAWDFLVFPLICICDVTPTSRGRKSLEEIPTAVWSYYADLYIVYVRFCTELLFQRILYLKEWSVYENPCVALFLPNALLRWSRWIQSPFLSAVLWSFLGEITAQSRHVWKLQQKLFLLLILGRFAVKWGVW